MSSCTMNNQDSDEEVDLEALRLAALKSRKTKYSHRVNHNNLIPIVPVSIESTDFIETKIKKEKLSPPPGDKNAEILKESGNNKENEDDKVSNFSGITFENDPDILSVDDKEEEDSLEKLMDQLEAEISGKAPLPCSRIVLSSKNSTSDKKNEKKLNKTIKDGDDEIELVQVKTGKEPGAIIEIRESASPENTTKDSNIKKTISPYDANLNRRSRSPFRSRSRSPFSIGRSNRRSRSPYWLKSPRRSRSPFRRSRSPFWMSRRSRSSSRKSRSPLRRFRSPNRKRSPYARFSRSRSKSYDRRRSPWSLSPKRRSKSPFYRDGSPFCRRRNFNSPMGRIRRSFSPRESSKSPRRRSRSPRRFFRNSPFHRSKSPFRRSKSPIRRIMSPFQRRSKTPINKANSPPYKKPLVRRSKSPNRWPLSPGRRPKSSDRSSPKRRSKSPPKKSDTLRKSPKRRLSNDGRSLSFSTSPTPRRNRSPLRVVEKNKLESNERSEKPKERTRNEKRHRSLSRENNRMYDRRPYNKQRNFRRFSPSKNRKSVDSQTKASRSPKQKQNQSPDGSKKEPSNRISKETNTVTPSAASDPILEARKRKFENLNEVDPSVDKKISLKSVKESTENNEDDEDALTINLEGNLWDDSEESGDEFESRFKSNDARKNSTIGPNRTVLSFRNLRDGDSASRKTLLNKPLIQENRAEKFGREDRHDRWRRNAKTDVRKSMNVDGKKAKNLDLERSKVKNNNNMNADKSERRSDRKPIVWSRKDESKSDKNFKENEVSTTQSDIKEVKGKSSDKVSDENKKLGKTENLLQDTDDFDKLISDFEKELENDICLTTKVFVNNQADIKRPKISVKRDLFEPKGTVEPVAKKQAPARTVKISEAASKKTDINLEDTSAFIERNEKANLENLLQDGPEDYIEDDDFVLEVSARRKLKNKVEDDNQSDLRAVLSRRRNEKLKKVVNFQENTRLVQSAFQGLGNKKSKRQDREVHETVEFPFDESVRNTGVERRRVLLLQREKNPSVTSNKNLVPEVKPDTTIYQRFSRPKERMKRKLQRQQDSMDDMDQEENEDGGGVVGGFEIEEEKQSRRFRLKRNVTLNSQVQN